MAEKGSLTLKKKTSKVQILLKPYVLPCIIHLSYLEEENQQGARPNPTFCRASYICLTLKKKKTSKVLTLSKPYVLRCIIHLSYLEEEDQQGAHPNPMFCHASCMVHIQRADGFWCTKTSHSSKHVACTVSCRELDWNLTHRWQCSHDMHAATGGVEPEAQGQGQRSQHGACAALWRVLCQDSRSHRQASLNILAQVACTAPSPAASSECAEDDLPFLSKFYKVTKKAWANSFGRHNNMSSSSSSTNLHYTHNEHIEN